MASANVVFIMGNLTRDPVSRDTKGGTVCDLGVAINESYTDKAGVRKESTVYVDVVVWGKTAEFCANNLRKGAQVVVEGKLQLDQWEKDGEKRSKLKVNAMRVQAVGGREPAGDPRVRDVRPEDTDDVPL